MNELYQDQVIDSEIEQVLPGIDEVRMIDPEVVDNPETRECIKLGLWFIQRITNEFGTPNKPRWSSGSVEQQVLMSYHNGGYDGHTSTGAHGAGVPKNALELTLITNKLAGKPIFSPFLRACAFLGGAGHDLVQNCGRTLLPEGQGKNRGDERLSTKFLREICLKHFSDPKIAVLAPISVTATAFNPNTLTQNVDYSEWNSSDNPDDPSTQRILAQEVVAAADLLSISSPRGPLGVIEYCIESLCREAKGQILQTVLTELNIPLKSLTSIKQVLEPISSEYRLRQAFIESLKAQRGFFANVVLSYPAIKKVANVDLAKLFEDQRQRNIAIVEEYVSKLVAEEATVVEIWEDSHKHAHSVAA